MNLQEETLDLISYLMTSVTEAEYVNVSDAVKLLSSLRVKIEKGEEPNPLLIQQINKAIETAISVIV